MKKIILKNRRDASVLRMHPWVFSGAVQKEEGSPIDGDLVEVFSNRGKFLASGHYQNGSILVRLLSYEQQEIDADFWIQKIKKAYQYRLNAGILGLKDTDCFRLVHAEGDQAPGLIIDIYGETAVMQCHSIGMFKARVEIAEAIKEVLGDRIQHVYNKSKTTLPKKFAEKVKDEYLLGGTKEGADTVYEHAYQFKVNWEEGQKTGFFLDQRDNRSLLRQYVEGKTVLNAFCYTGGFSVYSLAAGAKQVDSVDISGKAMQLTAENVALNGGEDRHRCFTHDVLKYLQATKDSYEVMVVDPPAFAKSLKKRHNAVQGYKRLNALALKKIKPGGILFTFSCSQVVGRQLFQDTIVAAAIEARRKVRIMHWLSQPADHPVNLFHPEGSYLKGLVVYVEE